MGRRPAKESWYQDLCEVTVHYENVKVGGIEAGGACLPEQGKATSKKDSVKEVNVLERKAVEGSYRNKRGNKIKEQRTQTRMQRGKHCSQEWITDGITGRQEREGCCSPSALSLLPMHPSSCPREFSTTHILTGHTPLKKSFCGLPGKIQAPQYSVTGPLCSVHPFHSPPPQPPSKHPDIVNVSHMPFHLCSCCSFHLEFHSHFPQSNPCPQSQVFEKHPRTWNLLGAWQSDHPGVKFWLCHLVVLWPWARGCPLTKPRHPQLENGNSVTTPQSCCGVVLRLRWTQKCQQSPWHPPINASFSALCYANKNLKTLTRPGNSILSLRSPWITGALRA